MEIKKINNPLISIIIPTYNSGIFLNECLNSVVNQSYKNIEIIIVDNESSDNTISIINDYSFKDNRIKLYITQNEGVSSARNLALSKSNGEYVLFVDSDDYLKDSNDLERLIRISDNCDIIRFGFNTLLNDALIENNDLEKLKDSYSTGNDYLVDVLNHNNEYGWYLWQYLFKKDLWSGITFPEGRIFEDTCSIYKVLLKANTVKVDKNIVYTYRNNISGVSKKINYKICDDMMYAINESSKYVSSLSIPENTKELLLNNFSFNYISVVNALNFVEKEEKNKVKELLKNNIGILDNCKFGKAKTIRNIINIFGVNLVGFGLKIRKNLRK